MLYICKHLTDRQLIKDEWQSICQGNRSARSSGSSGNLEVLICKALFSPRRPKGFFGKIRQANDGVPGQELQQMSLLLQDRHLVLVSDRAM